MPTRNGHGFALVEILIAMTIALLTLSALVHLQRELIRTGLTARELGAAAALAEDRSESLLSQARGGFAAPAGGAEQTALEPGGAEGLYSRSWSSIASDRAADFEVTVEWPSGGDGRLDVRISSASELAGALASGYATVGRKSLPAP
jgi:Tfp pilus assembly protein PilV